MKKFTKDDFQVGMLVEVDEMGLCLVMKDKEGLAYVNENRCLPINCLNDDLNHCLPQYSINKVYSRPINWSNGILDTNNRLLLWEREVRELTVAEISERLGYPVKVVDE